MIKLEQWKQLSPKDQAVVLLMAVEGHINNIENGISTKYQKIYNLIEELKELNKRLPDKW